MKKLLVLITYNRLEYTKRTLRDIWENTSDGADYLLVVVDNNSNDGTQNYLKEQQRRGRINILVLNPDNYYPGKAANIGWATGLEVFEPELLVRIDNDMHLEKNWDLEADKYFQAIPELGQLGLEHEAIETPEAELHRRYINGYTINEWPGCVGGPMVMRKKLWDLGVRYNEEPWQPGAQEDSKLSAEIKNRGFLVGHAQEELGRTFATKSNRDEFMEYYKKTFGERGLEEQL